MKKEEINDETKDILNNEKQMNENNINNIDALNIKKLDIKHFENIEPKKDDKLNENDIYNLENNVEMADFSNKINSITEEFEKHIINNSDNIKNEELNNNNNTISNNKNSSLNKNINQNYVNIDNDIKQKDNNENISKNINNNNYNEIINMDIINQEKMQVDLNNEIKDVQKIDDKNKLLIEENDDFKINEEIIEKKYSSENSIENNYQNNKEKDDNDEHLNTKNEKNLEDENDNELLNYKNISDSEKIQNKNEPNNANGNKEAEVINAHNENNSDIIQKLLNNKNDENEGIELYSFEGNENNQNNINDNMNEEYFINQNIINFQNKNSNKDNINNNEIKKNDNIENTKNSIELKEKNNASEEKESKGIIRADIYKIYSKDINILDNNEEDAEKENEINNILEKELPFQKDAMQKLQLVISKKEAINNDNNINNEYINKDLNAIKEEKTDRRRNNSIKNGIYKKNTNKIPFRKFQINNKAKKNKNLELKVENEDKLNLNIEKYKTLDNQDKYNNIINKKNYTIKTNPSLNNKAKSKIQDQYKTAYIPYNNYIKFFQKTSFKDNISQKEAQKKYLNNTKQNDFSFDGVYQKRNLKKADYSMASTSRVYSKHNKINKGRYSFNKYKSKKPNENDINEIKRIQNKEKLNINMDQLFTPENNMKQIPLSGQNRIKTNNYINYINYSNNNYEYNYINNGINNSNINNLNMHLFNSKTNNNYMKKRMMNNQNNFDISSDGINQNIFVSNQNNNTNYRKKEYNNINFYQKNINNYNTTKNFHITNQPNRFNQSLPYSQKNNIIRDYFLSNVEHYNDDNKYNIENYEDDREYYINEVSCTININIEDLIIIEEKLNEIIYFLKSIKNVKNQCYDFWNFFYFSSLPTKLEKSFKNEQIKQIIKLSINLELISSMLCYEFSFDESAINKAYILLLEILEINHNNLILINENILNRLIKENPENRWIPMLNKIVKSYINKNPKFYYQNSLFSEKINNNNDKLIKKLKSILLNYHTEFSSLILSLLKKINQKSSEEINDFFQEYILRKDNIANERNFDFKRVNPPYILSERKKNFTLVLSLDETLIHLQQINYKQGSLKLRPFLIEFLEGIKPYYELILFTSKTEYYTLPVLNVIQRKKQYFDFILYRENCYLSGYDYVKDLTRIGRPLDSTIIIDNIPQNFKFQKDNGINIKSFWAQDPNDRALYDLISILVNIALEANDVRDSLEKYREEIVGKIISKTDDNSL